jgi:hypothetical protein
MNLPNLPTDNLYKFIALAGLTIIFFSMVLPIIALHNLKLELLKTNGELSVLQAEFEFLRDDMEVAKRNPSPETAPRLGDKMKELRIRTLQLKSKDEAERFLHRQTIIWQSVATIGISIGSLMLILGFKFWYQRVQKYQDLILKKEAGELSEGERLKTDTEPSPPETEGSQTTPAARG